MPLEPTPTSEPVQRHLEVPPAEPSGLPYDLERAGGSDKIHGGFGNDVIHGGGGSDQINGNRGSDVIFGDFSSTAIVTYTYAYVTPASARAWATSRPAAG